jgi:uncharacterized protein (DUF362 family)
MLLLPIGSGSCYVRTDFRSWRYPIHRRWIWHCKTGSTIISQAFEAFGIGRVAYDHRVELINFETSGFVEVDIPCAKQFSHLHISKAVLEVNIIVSFSKLKTHELTFYIEAVKNFFGIILQKTLKQAHFLELMVQYFYLNLNPHY